MNIPNFLELRNSILNLLSYKNTNKNHKTFPLGFVLTFSLIGQISSYKDLGPDLNNYNLLILNEFLAN